MTFFISSYKRPVAAKAGCVLNIDLSADSGFEKSPAQWNEAENNISKIIRWRDYSVWVSCSVCWGLSELACFCERSPVIHLLHLNHSANKLTHKYQVLPSVLSPICQRCTCNPIVLLIPRSYIQVFLPLNPTSLLSSSCKCSLQLSIDLPAEFKLKMTYKKKEEKSVLMRPEHTVLIWHFQTKGNAWLFTDLPNTHACMYLQYILWRLSLLSYIDWNCREFSFWNLEKYEHLCLSQSLCSIW